MIIKFEDLKSMEIEQKHPMMGFKLGFIDDFPPVNTEISIKLNYKDDSQLTLNCIVTNSVHRSPKVDLSDLLKDLDLVWGKPDGSMLIGEDKEVKFLGDK